MDDRSDVAGEVGGVRIGRQLAVRFRALEAPAYCSLARHTARSQLLPDGIARLAAGKRTLHHEASPRIARICEQAGGPAQQPLNDVARRRLIQRLAQVGCRPIVVAVERLAEQGLLIAKGGIKARAVDSHGLGQIRQGRALESFAPKHPERALQRLIHVEGARTSHRRTGLLFLHTWQSYAAFIPKGKEMPMTAFARRSVFTAQPRPSRLRRRFGQPQTNNHSSFGARRLVAAMARASERKR